MQLTVYSVSLSVNSTGFDDANKTPRPESSGTCANNSAYVSPDFWGAALRGWRTCSALTTLTTC